MRRALPFVALLSLFLCPQGRARAGDPAPTAPPPVRVIVPGAGFYRVKAAALRAHGYADDQHLAATARRRAGVVSPRDAVSPPLTFALPMESSRVGDDVVFFVPDRRSRIPAAITLTLGAPATKPAAPGSKPPKELADAPGPRLGRAMHGDRVFGPLAAAESSAYDAPYTTWFFARMEPGGSLALPVDGAAAPGTVQSLLLMAVSAVPTRLNFEASYAGQRVSEGRSDTMFRWDVPNVVPGHNPSRSVT